MLFYLPYIAICHRTDQLYYFFPKKCRYICQVALKCLPAILCQKYQCQSSLNCCKVHDSVVRKLKLWWLEMTGETRMSLAVAGRKRQTMQTVPENRGCDRKWATAGCWQTVLRNVQLQRERRPQTATTWQAWYRNKLIQIRWRHTVQQSVCHERQFKVNPLL